MANYRAIATGNWSAGATWAGGAVPPNGAHDVYANNFTVTIDQNINVNLITNASNAGTFVGGGTAAAGGTFALTNEVVVTANISRNNTSQAAGCVTTAGTVSAAIVGNITSNSVGGNTVNSTIVHGSTGILTITGNLFGGTQAGSGTYALFNSTTGTVNINGNVTGGSGGNSTNTFAHAVFNNSTGIINISNGNVTGGGGASSNGQSYTGICGVAGSGQINIVGNCLAGQNTNAFAISCNGSQATIQGDITAANGINAVSSTATTNFFSGSFTFSADGTAPIICSKYRVSPAPLNARTRYAANGSGTYVDMFTADNNLGQANPTDVRSGVSYASGQLTGRLTVPARGSVALSVNYGPSMPFTATRSGTTATATLAYSYPLVVGDQITVTGASNAEWNSTYTIASVVSGTSVTFNVPNTHSATAGTGALLQTTGTAVLDPAAVASAVWGAASRTITGGLVDTATTLTNAPTVPSVVQIRQEMDANSVKLANLDASVSSRSTLTAAQVNAEADTALADVGLTNTVTGRIDAAISSRLSPSGTLATVTNLTNAPASVTPSDIWSHATRTLTTSSGPTAVQIRQEIDASSTQLAAIKAKTDLLETTRLAQCSTVATTGAQLAAALS
jgi:hypothetical protein